MTTDAEWMAAQERDYNRGTFAGMSKEIALRALDAAERAVIEPETGLGAPNAPSGNGNTSLNVQPLRTALRGNTGTTMNEGDAA